MLIDLNECNLINGNNCSEFAFCNNTFSSYTCQCKPGFIDENLELPGRLCTGKHKILCENVSTMIQNQF